MTHSSIISTFKLLNIVLQSQIWTPFEKKSMGYRHPLKSQYFSTTKNKLMTRSR